MKNQKKMNKNLIGNKSEILLLLLAIHATASASDHLSIPDSTF